nr:unnamed protein product [Digitaria exilis]
MNHAEVSGLLSVGMHGTDGGEESYAAEYPKMDQDTSHETTKFNVVMATSAVYTDNISTDACLDEYNMSGIQPMEEIRFGSAQPFELQSKGLVADSEEESLPSSPETSCASDYDMPGYMEQNLQHIYNAYDAVVERGQVVLSPAFIICDETSHLEPHLTFSLDGIKIEYLDLDSLGDKKMITLQWELSNIISISCKWAQSVGSAFITLIAGSEAETQNAGSVTVQFCLDDSQWPQRQQKIWEIGPRYQEIWKDIQLTEDFEDVIYPQGEPDAVSISKRDADLLLPETFVNDTIIDFYIKYLSTRIESTEKRRYHFFNSFFFRKLADLDKDQGRAPEGRAAFLRVRKWTRKINVFEKDFLFIPVNFSLHWSLIVICYPGEVIVIRIFRLKFHVFYTWIHLKEVMLGSRISFKGQFYVSSILSWEVQTDNDGFYLWEEWKERHPDSASDNSDKFLNLRFVSLELPQQDNSFDCGLFLLHYAELFLMDAPRNFNPLKIDEFSDFLSRDWFAPAEASLKRSVVRKLIHELVTGSFQNHPKLACGSEQPDEKHEGSSNAEPGPAGEFLVQRCSDDEPNTVCTVRDGNHETQSSKSICLNDSEEKGLTTSGCMLDAGRVSTDEVNNTQGPEVSAADKDTIVCLLSQDEKNEPLIAESNNQIDMRSFARKEVLKGSEGEVQDIMVSMSSAISETDAQDMDSVMMFDSSKDDDGPNPERITAEGDCDYPHEAMGSVTLGDIDKDYAKCEDSLVDPVMAENAVIEDVKKISTAALGDIDKDYAKCEDSVDPVMAENAVIEDVKEISTADPVTIENTIIENVKDISTTANNVNHGELCASSQLPEGNADYDITDDGCELKTGSDNNGITGVSTSSPDLKEENVDKVVAGDCIRESDINAEYSSDLKVANTGNAMTGGITFSSDMEGNTDQTIAGDCTNGIGVNADGEDADSHKNFATDSAADVALSMDIQCSMVDETVSADTSDDAKRPMPDVTFELVDRPCSPKNEISEKTSLDCKRPAPDGSCEENDIVISGDKCIHKDDGQGNDAKIERHYKRRKVLALEKQQSFSGATPLD